MSYLGAKFISTFGIGRLSHALIVRKGRFVLNFHGIIRERREDLPPSIQPGLTIEEFDYILRWLKKRFAFLTPDELIQTNKPGVLLTFDDGKANNFTNALPMLERHNAPAIFFVSTQHVLEPMNWLHFTRTKVLAYWDRIEDVPEDIAWDLYRGMSMKQLIACSKHNLITIASHTISHPLLSRCNKTAMKRELEGSKQQLEELISKKVEMFAYPNGDYNSQVIQVVHDTGYKWVFAVKPHNIGFSQYEIPRVDIGFAHPYYLDAKLCGLHRLPIKSNFSEF